MQKLFITFLLVALCKSGLFAQTFHHEKKVTPLDRSSLDYFGAFLDISDDVAIISSSGAKTDENDENPLDGAGAAYAYERINETWGMAQKIVPSDRNSNDVFGSSVAIDGNFTVIGASLNATDADGMNEISRAGAAFIFEREESGIWAERQKIVASDRGENDNFGFPITMSGDRLAVSSVFHNSRQGAVYVFEKNGSGHWVEQAKLVADDAESSATFGFSIDMDGDLLAVGARAENKDQDGQNYVYQSGAAYLFKRTALGHWNQIQKGVPDDRMMNDFFGSSIDLEGSTLIIGAPHHDQSTTSSLNQAGAVYIFKEDENESWVQTQKLVASDRSQLDYFGEHLSLSGDYLVVGVPEEDEDEAGADTKEQAGAVYLFERDPEGNFSEVQKLVASDRSEENQFGVGIKLKGERLLVGSFGNALDAAGENDFSNAGAAYFFEWHSKDSPKIDAQVSLSNLVQTFDGTFKKVEALTSPPGLSLAITYNEVSNMPIDAGSYRVEAIIQDDHYKGSASEILTIMKANASISLTGKEQVADGDLKEPVVTTTPEGLNYVIDWTADLEPRTAGSYPFTVTIDEPNYNGEISETLILTASNILGLAGHQSLQVFPNPAQNYLHIQSDQVLNVEVIGLDGRLLIKAKSNQAIDIRSLNEGFYLLNLSDGNGVPMISRTILKN